MFVSQILTNPETAELFILTQHHLSMIIEQQMEAGYHRNP